MERDPCGHAAECAATDSPSQPVGKATCSERAERLDREVIPPALAKDGAMSWVDGLFWPFAVCGAVATLSFNVLEWYSFGTGVGVYATAIAVWTAHTATAANDRRARLDQRDRLLLVYGAALSILTTMGDPEGSVTNEETMDGFQRLDIALQASRQVAHLSECEALREVLMGYAGVRAWDDSVWNKAIRALEELMPRLGSPP